MRLPLLLSLGLAACGTDVYQEPPADPPPAPRATWYQDVAPIVAQHCAGCHEDGGIAPFALTAYEDAVDNAPRMLDKIHKGEMPPFGAREEADCTPRFSWKDDPRLSPTELETLEHWVADGTPEGTLAPIPAPPVTDLTGVTQTLTPSVPFVSAGTRDQFICTVLDPALPQGGWLTGMQVHPGNPTVVHHAVITELFAGAPLDALVAARGVGVPWDCSAAQQPGSLVVTLWTPGNQPMETSGELAVPVLAGAKLVMQIHYHPAGKTNAPDATSLDLRTSTVWPKKMYFVGAFGNSISAPELQADPDDRTAIPEFRIPANKADHVEHMHITVPDLGGLQDVRLYSANPHMHLIGSHISGTITRPTARGNDPAKECLANGTWNFDWQRTYVYDAPLEDLPSVQAGDVIDIACHWNNTYASPFVQRALEDAGLVVPVDVTLGEGNSTDEMCLEIFGIAVDAPAQPTAMLVPEQMPMALLHTLTAR